MARVVTRLDDELCRAIDDLVAAGVVISRSEAIRVGLERLVDKHRRARLGAAIVAGYQALPQTEHDVCWPDAATAQMIASETW